MLQRDIYLGHIMGKNLIKFAQKRSEALCTINNWETGFFFARILSNLAVHIKVSAENERRSENRPKSCCLQTYVKCGDAPAA